MCVVGGGGGGGGGGGHMLIILTLTFIQDRTGLNHDNNKSRLYQKLFNGQQAICCEDSPTEGL